VSERKVSGNRPAIEIAGVDVAAIDAGCSRSGEIKPVLDKLVQQFTGRWDAFISIKPLNITGGTGSPANATAIT